MRPDGIFMRRVKFLQTASFRTAYWWFRMKTEPLSFAASAGFTEECRRRFAHGGLSDLGGDRLKAFLILVAGLGITSIPAGRDPELHQDPRLHIIYLAVDPEMQHHGIAATLVEEAVAYAGTQRSDDLLETHNPRNVAFYQQFGFKVYGVGKAFSLKQYCLLCFGKSRKRNILTVTAAISFAKAHLRFRCFAAPLVMKWSSLPASPGSRFSAGAKSAPRKLRVNCSTILDRL